MFKILVAALVVFIGSCSQMTNDEKMRGSASELIGYLKTCDTASIVKLHYGYQESMKQSKGYSESVLPIVEECRRFQKITGQYGIPKATDFVYREGMLGSHELVIPILRSPDSMLMMDSCSLIVTYYPFDIADPREIKNFYLAISRHKTRDTILIAPSIKELPRRGH